MSLIKPMGRIYQLCLMVCSRHHIDHVRNHKSRFNIFS